MEDRNIDAEQDSIRFIHAADIRLDMNLSGEEGLAELSPRLEGVALEAFRNLVDCALERHVDFVLLAGDLCNCAESGIGTILFLTEQLARLSEAGIACYIAHGDRDPLDAWARYIKFPPLVYRFDSQTGFFPILKKGDVVGSVRGYSFPTSQAIENVVPSFASPCFPGEPETGIRIALLHCHVGPAREQRHVFSCRLDDLKEASRESGIDYWALGHSHARALLLPSEPCVAYPGALQGNGVGEKGPHGAWVVSLRPGGIPDMEFVVLDALRWEECELDVSALREQEDLLAAWADIKEELRLRAARRPVLLRLLLTGRSKMKDFGGALAPAGESGRSRPDFLTKKLNAGEMSRKDFVVVDCWEDRTTLASNDLALAGDGFVRDFLREVAFFEANIDPRLALFETLKERGLLKRLLTSEAAPLLEALTESDVDAAVRTSCRLANRFVANRGSTGEKMEEFRE